MLFLCIFSMADYTVFQTNCLALSRQIAPVRKLRQTDQTACHQITLISFNERIWHERTGCWMISVGYFILEKSIFTPSRGSLLWVTISRSMVTFHSRLHWTPGAISRVASVSRRGRIRSACGLATSVTTARVQRQQGLLTPGADMFSWLSLYFQQQRGYFFSKFSRHHQGGLFREQPPMARCTI